MPPRPLRDARARIDGHFWIQIVQSHYVKIRSIVPQVTLLCNSDVKMAVDPEGLGSCLSLIESSRMDRAFVRVNSSSDRGGQADACAPGTTGLSTGDCEPNEVFQGEILREIENFFLNDPTNSFHRTFHERKPGYVNLKIEGWFTRKQIINNYEMLIKELDDWKINKDGIRWKYK